MIHRYSSRFSLLKVSVNKRFCFFLKSDADTTAQIIMKTDH